MKIEEFAKNIKKKFDVCIELVNKKAHTFNGEQKDFLWYAPEENDYGYTWRGGDRWYSEKFDMSEVSNFEIYYEDREIYLTIVREYETHMIYLDEFREMYQDPAWGQMVFNHGIDAIRAGGEYSDAYMKLTSVLVNNEREICCSTSKMGPYGIAVTGDVCIASTSDVWSEVDPESGKRWIEDWSELITDPNDSYFINEGRIENNSYYGHDEIIVKNYNIEFIWVHKWCNQINDIIRFSEETGIPYFII